SHLPLRARTRLPISVLSEDCIVFFQAEDGIRDGTVTGVQTCALPILASKSPDSAIANEAGQAARNLATGLARFQTIAWAFPFFSSRWHDAFGYGQVKTEMRLGKLPFHPYISVRFVGDVRDTAGSTLSNPAPQYLS